MFDRLIVGRSLAEELVPRAQRVWTCLRRDVPNPPYSVADRRRDFGTVFRDTPAGRRVLAQVLDRCRVCERSYVSGDSLETARREGMRDTGLWLLEILDNDAPDRPGTAEAEPRVPDERA